MSGKLIMLACGISVIGYLAYLTREYTRKQEQSEKEVYRKGTEYRGTKEDISEPIDFSDMYDDNIPTKEDEVLDNVYEVSKVDDLEELDDLDTLEDIDDSEAPIVNCEPVSNDNIDKLMHDLQENRIQNKNKGVSELPPIDDTEIVDMSEFETLDKALSEESDWVSDADYDSLI